MSSVLKCVALALVVPYVIVGFASEAHPQEDVDELIQEATYQLHCETNFRYLAVLFSAWENQHGHRFPDTLSDLYPDYISDEDLSVFVCPNTGHRPGDGTNIDEWCDYVYVKGQRWTERGGRPTLVLYEKPDNHSDGRHELYSDGSVEWKPIYGAAQILVLYMMAFVVGTLFSAICLWVAMLLTRLQGTFVAIATIAAISTLVGLIPVVGWILAIIVMFVLICKWTDAEFWPDAVLMVVVANVVSAIARAALVGLLAR